MSDDIKPGQVWAWNNQVGHCGSRIEIISVDAGRVRYGYQAEDFGPFNTYADWLHEQAHLVPPAAAPAPLDPSKVKAGDTVTVEVTPVPSSGGRPYTIHGEVSGGIGGQLWVGPVFLQGNGKWRPGITLTDHQPAPEPEPAWEPGMVATATTSDPHRGVNGAVLGLFVGDPENDTPVRFETYSGDTYPLAALSNVRPLVVIDPAAVDVDHLVDIGSNTDDPRTNTPAILAGLGIEAP